MDLKPYLERGAVNVLRNCHVKGLTSVLLHDEPENRVRVFLTEPDHELWKADPLALGIHPHHCDITMVPLFGRVVNQVYANPKPGGPFQKCLYRSAITGTGGALERTEEFYSFENVTSQALSETLFMRADLLHTVYVPEGEQAAWAIYESREDPEYVPVCYTDNPIFDTTGLYVPDMAYAEEAIRYVLSRS